MATIETGRHRGNPKPLPFWRLSKRRKDIDLLTGRPAGRLYRLGLKNTTDPQVLGFRIRLLPGEVKFIEDIMLSCLKEKCERDQTNYFLRIWYVSALVEMSEEYEQTEVMDLPPGVAPL